MTLSFKNLPRATMALCNNFIVISFGKQNGNHITEIFLFLNAGYEIWWHGYFIL